MAAQIQALSNVALEDLFGKGHTWGIASEDFLKLIKEGENRKTPEELLKCVASLDLDDLEKRFRNRGWGGFVTKDLLELWLGGLAKNSQKQQVPQSIARSIIYLYIQNYVGFCEEIMVTASNLENDEKEKFLEVLSKLGMGADLKAAGADSNLFLGLHGFLKERGASADVDTPLTFLEFLQHTGSKGQGAKLISEVVGETNLKAWMEQLKKVKYIDDEKALEEWQNGIKEGFSHFEQENKLFFDGGPTLLNLVNPGADDERQQKARVTFKMNLTNNTDKDLKLNQMQVVQGWVKEAIVTVKANKKQSMNGRHLYATATGCVGSCAWSIGDSGKILVVMYSAPFDFNLYSNWLAVGIFDETKRGNYHHEKGEIEDFFKKMYYDDEKDFKREEYYRTSDKVTFEKDGYSVEGEMDKNHTPNISVTIKTNRPRRL